MLNRQFKREGHVFAWLIELPMCSVCASLNIYWAHISVTFGDSQWFASSNWNRRAGRPLNEDHHRQQGKHFIATLPINQSMANNTANTFSTILMSKVTRAEIHFQSHFTGGEIRFQLSCGQLAQLAGQQQMYSNIERWCFIIINHCQPLAWHTSQCVRTAGVAVAQRKQGEKCESEQMPEERDAHSQPACVIV